MGLSNHHYDRGKWMVLVFLPALSVLVKGLGELFMWDAHDLLVTVINLVAAFMGSLLQVSSKAYYLEDSQADGKGGLS